MKNLYMFQVNYSYGRSAHLPYAAAALVSYAMADRDVAGEYALGDMFFLRGDIDRIMDKMKEPAVVGFSTYIWNFEFNKAAAKKIKERWPDCVIVFGGHQVAPGGSLLEQCPYIDYLIHSEGEEPLRRLLLALCGKDRISDIPGLSYRSANGVASIAPAVNRARVIDYPSPYLSGYFDKLLADHPDIEFIALIETSRGCHNSCSYCDWSVLSSMIRQFPLERVYAELDWISEHHIVGLGSADSNFGFLPRDEDIIDYMISLYKKNGYPQKFQASYAKNSNERIFRIGKKLDECGLNKGITISFQSMSDVVLDNVGRHNITTRNYSQLMKMYNDAGIATYTELILGLPGETVASFRNGIDELLELGQHNSIYIHDLELLPCSAMADPSYVQRFGITTSRIVLNEPHIDRPGAGEISEYSELVTSTSSMTTADWISMNLFAFTVQSFHNMGLLEFFALYLRREKDVRYGDFYAGFMAWLSTADCGGAGDALKLIKKSLAGIVSGDSTASFVVSDSRFGSVCWPFDEYLFLCTAYDLDVFYQGVASFLAGYGIDAEVFDELLRFQKDMIKLPGGSAKRLDLRYDFISYFRAILTGSPADLQKKSVSYEVSSLYTKDWPEYAKRIVWFGHKDSRNTYIDEAVAAEDEQ